MRELWRDKVFVPHQEVLIRRCKSQGGPQGWRSSTPNKGLDLELQKMEEAVEWMARRASRRVAQAYKPKLYSAACHRRPYWWDMQKFSKWNKGYRYLPVVLDVLSKYGWIIPLKKKKGETVANTFNGVERTVLPRRYSTFISLIALQLCTPGGWN